MVEIHFKIISHRPSSEFTIGTKRCHQGCACQSHGWRIAHVAVSPGHVDELRLAFFPGGTAEAILGSWLNLIWRIISFPPWIPIIRAFPAFLIPGTGAGTSIWIPQAVRLLWGSCIPVKCDRLTWKNCLGYTAYAVEGCRYMSMAIARYLHCLNSVGYLNMREFWETGRSRAEHLAKQKAIPLSVSSEDPAFPSRDFRPMVTPDNRYRWCLDTYSLAVCIMISHLQKHHRFNGYGFMLQNSSNDMLASILRQVEILMQSFRLLNVCSRSFWIYFSVTPI